MANIARKTVTGTIWLTIAQLVGMFMSLGANIVIARYVTPAEFGSFALASSLTGLFFILSSWSLGMAIVQSDGISESFVHSGYFLSFLAWIFPSILIALSSFLLMKVYSLQVIHFLWILSVLQLFSILGSFQGALLERRLEYKSYSLVLIFARILSWTVAVLLAILGTGAWSFIVQYLLMVSIQFVGYKKLTKYKFRWELKRESLKRLFRFGGQMFIAQSLTLSFYRLNNFMIGTWAGLTNLGYFKQAFTLSEMGHRFSWPALGQVPFAAYSKLQNEIDKLSYGYELVSYFILRLLAPIGLVFFILGEEMMVFLYGEKWRPAGELLQYLAIYAISMPFFENMRSLLYSQDKIPGVIVTVLLQLGMMIPSMYIALKLIGVLGAVYVLDVVMIIGTCIIYLWARKLVHIRIKRIVFPPLLASSGILLTWHFSTKRIHPVEANFQDIILGVTVIFGLYFILLSIIERNRLFNAIQHLIQALKPKMKI